MEPGWKVNSSPLCRWLNWWCSVARSLRITNSYWCEELGRPCTKYFYIWLEPWFRLRALLLRTRAAHKCPELQLQGIWQSLLASMSVCLRVRINRISECSTLRPRVSERPRAGKESRWPSQHCGSKAVFFSSMVFLVFDPGWPWTPDPPFLSSCVVLQACTTPDSYPWGSPFPLLLLIFFPFDILRQGLTI